MAGGDCRIDQVATKRSQPGERSLLVRAGEPAITDDIGNQDRSIFRVSLMARPHAFYLSTRRIGSADLVIEMLIWVCVSAR